MDAEVEYNNRARVADSAQRIAGWARDAAQFRAMVPAAELGLAYGPGEREKLDLFRPALGEACPIALFIHGGYWQALDRSYCSHLARGLLAHGVAVAIPSYALCPEVPLGRIVAQLQAATAFLHRRGARRVFAFGHSAGGQLAALMMATRWQAFDAALPARLVTGILPISGVFELEPLLATSLNTALGLDAGTARAYSPRWLAPPGGALHAVVGGEESPEFLRQTRDFAAAWGGTAEIMQGRNHFTVLDPLVNPQSPLTRRAAAMALAAG